MVCSCPKRSKCIWLIYLIGFDPIDILYMRSQCPHSSPERALQLVKNATSIPKCVTMKWDNGGRGWGKTVDEIPAKKNKNKNKTGMYNKLGNRMITHFLNWVTTNLGDSSICPDGRCLSLRSSKPTDLIVTDYFILLNLVQQLLITQTFPWDQINRE